MRQIPNKNNSQRQQAKSKVASGAGDLLQNVG
jgi:hypothetical protein